MGTKRPLEHSKRLIVPERLSGSSLSLVQAETSFSWEKDLLSASLLWWGLSQSHRASPTAPFKPKRWVTSRSFVDYLDSKRIHLKPDIVEYACNGAPPLYNLILGKEILHDLGVLLDFNEKTITIDEILLAMRNTNYLQLKPSITRALKLTCPRTSKHMRRY